MKDRRTSASTVGAAVAIAAAAALVAGAGLTVVLTRARPSGTPVAVSALSTAGSTATSPGSSMPVAAPASDGTSSQPSTAPATASSGGSSVRHLTGATSPAPTAVAHPPAASMQVAAGANQAAGSSGPSPAAPGTYRYRQAGSLPGTPAEGTLVVAPASASGTQVWTRVVGGTLPPSTAVMLFNATGSYLVSPSAQAVGAPAACTFAAPVPWPPWPTTPGRTVSAQASCTGPISSEQVTGRVQATATASLDGHSVTTSVVVNTFVLKGSFNGSAINVVLTETDWYAPTLRVPVLTRTQVAGTAVGLKISTERTDTLESATPTRGG